MKRLRHKSELSDGGVVFGDFEDGGFNVGIPDENDVIDGSGNQYDDLVIIVQGDDCLFVVIRVLPPFLVFDYVPENDFSIHAGTGQVLQFVDAEQYSDALRVGRAFSLQKVLLQGIS